MLNEYIQAAMRKAQYTLLEGGEGYVGEIPGFKGVLSNADNWEDCRNELWEVLEGWILFNLSDKTPLPVVDGLSLEFKKVEEDDAETK